MRQTGRTDKTGEIELPLEMGERLQNLFELDAAPVTVEGVLAALAARRFVPSSDQLIASDPSPHRLTMGDRSLFMSCVLDALLLPLLEGESAEISSLSPVSGQVVRAQLNPQDFVFDPPEAVVSFGVARDPQLSGTDALCRYNNAFTSAQEYETWRARTPEAATVMLPLRRAYALERDFVERATTHPDTRGPDAP